MGTFINVVVVAINVGVVTSKESTMIFTFMVLSFKAAIVATTNSWKIVVECFLIDYLIAEFLVNFNFNFIYLSQQLL